MFIKGTKTWRNIREMFKPEISVMNINVSSSAQLFHRPEIAGKCDFCLKQLS